MVENYGRLKTTNVVDDVTGDEVFEIANSGRISSTCNGLAPSVLIVDY